MKRLELLVSLGIGKRVWRLVESIGGNENGCGCGYDFGLFPSKRHAAASCLRDSVS